MAKVIKRIPPTVNRYTAKPLNSMKRRKVAGYARVSTDHEEQATSYEAQMDYYTSYINARPDWEFVGMYSDEGISATNTNHRDGFKQMIADALAGKIELIITKSVSRFARNTVDSLSTVRELKEHGVEIYFEKENIWTLDAKGELLITIMSSLAQEESRSISENVTWGHRKRFADGKASVSFSHFLGYDRGPNGEFVINSEEAITVRYIFKRYLEGYSTVKIAQELTAKGIKTPAGLDEWRPCTVNSILRNEKYKGDALLQKKFTKDFLTHKLVRNNGEVPQYYVEGHHEGIVTQEQFDLVQAEMIRRKSLGKYSGVGIFSSTIRCGDCGAFYGAKVWHSKDKYRKVIYRCNRKYEDGHTCSTKHFTEDEIKRGFVKAVNELFTDKSEIIENTKLIMNVVSDTSELDKAQAERIAAMKLIDEQIRLGIDENSRKPLDQTEYNKRYDELVEKYEKIKGEYEAGTEEIEHKNAQRDYMKGFIRSLENTGNVVQEFDEGLWSGLVQEVEVQKDGRLRYRFKNGAEITV